MDKYNSKIAAFIGRLHNQELYAVTVSAETTLYSCEEYQVLSWWRNHENKHKEQYTRYGWVGFMTRYLWYSLRYGYDKNPLEVEATEAQNG